MGDLIYLVLLEGSNLNVLVNGAVIGIAVAECPVIGKGPYACYLGGKSHSYPFVAPEAVTFKGVTGAVTVMVLLADAVLLSELITVTLAV